MCAPPPLADSVDIARRQVELEAGVAQYAHAEVERVNSSGTSSRFSDYRFDQLVDQNWSDVLDV